MAKRIAALGTHTELPAPDSSAFAAGFRETRGCYVLVGTAPQNTIDHAHFQDATGYECFMNKVHIIDYCRAGALKDALGFAFELRRQWAKSGFGKPMRFILSSSEDDDDAVARWHVLRPGETWLDDDLEGYREHAILEIDSTDAWPFAGLGR